MYHVLPINIPYFKNDTLKVKGDNGLPKVPIQEESRVAFYYPFCCEGGLEEDLSHIRN